MTLRNCSFTPSNDSATQILLIVSLIGHCVSISAHNLKNGSNQTKLEQKYIFLKTLKRKFE